jgi:hypothetical protein
VTSNGNDLLLLKAPPNKLKIDGQVVHQLGFIYLVHWSVRVTISSSDAVMLTFIMELLASWAQGLVVAREAVNVFVGEQACRK